jgi:hypothetical protein
LYRGQQLINHLGQTLPAGGRGKEMEGSMAKVNTTIRNRAHGGSRHSPAGAPGLAAPASRQERDALLRRQLAALLRYGAPPGLPAAVPLPSPPDPAPDGVSKVDCAGREWPCLDWPALLAMAQAERMDSLLYVALLAVDQWHAPPAAVRAELEAAYWRTKVANLLVLDAVHQLADAFATATVPAVVLKGAALAFTLYTDPAWRSLGDIDLLVHGDQVDTALQVLGRLGYVPPSGSLAEYVAARLAAGDARLLRRTSEVPLLRKDRLSTQVDLHWGLNGRALLRRGMDVGWFWDHTSLVPMGRREVRILDDDAQLLHLCAHMFQHGVPRLRWTYDIALLLARRSLAWEEVLAGAARNGLGLALQSSLAAVAVIWGVEPPASVQKLLATIPVTARERHLRRAMMSGNRRAVAAYDVLSQPDLGSALDACFAAALPPAAYMRRRYDIADARLLPAYYLLRALRGTILTGCDALCVLGARSGQPVPGDRTAAGISAAPVQHEGI